MRWDPNTVRVEAGPNSNRNALLYSMVLGHYRSRVEAVVADLVRHKGLFTHPWGGSMAVLQALMTIEAHATQLHRNMFGGTRYIEVAGPYAHAPFP